MLVWFHTAAAASHAADFGGLWVGSEIDRRSTCSDPPKGPRERAFFIEQAGPEVRVLFKNMPCSEARVGTVDGERLLLTQIEPDRCADGTAGSIEARLEIKRETENEVTATGTFELSCGNCEVVSVARLRRIAGGRPPCESR